MRLDTFLSREAAELNAQEMTRLTNKPWVVVESRSAFRVVPAERPVCPVCHDSADWCPEMKEPSK